jgi:hypothetical protein
MQSVHRIDDYQSFWREVVIPDFDDFMGEQSNLRRAFHCAISLFHMADWVYRGHKAYIHAHFTFTDKNGNPKSVYNEKSFANAIRDLHPDFELIRGIANSAKHLEIRQGTHPASPTHAANTSSHSSTWDTAEWDNDPWNSRGIILTDSGGNNYKVLALAESTYKMWSRLCQQHGWPLS